MSRFNNIKTSYKKILARIINSLDSLINSRFSNKSQSESKLKIATLPIKLGLSLILIFTIIFIIWGSFAPINSASIADGNIVLDFNKKTVQHLEGGIIEKIFIKEGDYVVTGQDLISLQNIQAKAQQNIYQKQFLTFKAVKTRLEAEKDYKSKFSLSNIKNDNNSSKTLDLDDIIKTQYDIYNIRKQSYLGKIQILEKRILQLGKQIEGLESQEKSVNKQLKIVYQQLDTITKLVKINNISINEKLELEKNIADLEGKKGSFMAQIAKIEQSISETRLEIINFQKENLNNILQELQETEMQIANLSEQVISTEDVLKRTIIKSPASGLVLNLKYHNESAVISPGADIMQIVPQDDNLIAEVKIKPQDIDLVKKGLKAKVSLSAFKAKKVPKLDGIVTYISADIINDEITGERYFLGRIKIDEDSFKDLKNDIKLYPGMPAQAFIITGSRSLMNYLITPIKDATYKSFREE